MYKQSNVSLNLVLFKEEYGQHESESRG